MFKTYADKLFEEGEVKGRTEGQEEGREEGQLEVILRLGRRKFGRPSAKQSARLRSITEPDRLLALSDRLLDSESWDELLR